MKPRNRLTYGIGVASVTLGVLLILLGLSELVLGVPSLGSSPLWIGGVAVLLGWFAMGGGRKEPEA